jgi:hypothetical protein
MPDDMLLNNKLIERLEADTVLESRIKNAVVNHSLDQDMLSKYPFLTKITESPGDYDQFVKIYAVLHGRGRWAKNFNNLSDSKQAEKVYDEYAGYLNKCMK